MRHAPGLQILDPHRMVGCVGQLPADVVRIIGPDASALSMQLDELTGHTSATDRSLACKRQVALSALDVQPDCVSHTMHMTRIIGALSHVAIQP